MAQELMDADANNEIVKQLRASRAKAAAANRHSKAAGSSTANTAGPVAEGTEGEPPASLGQIDLTLSATCGDAAAPAQAGPGPQPRISRVLAAEGDADYFNQMVRSGGSYVGPASHPPCRLPNRPAHTMRLPSGGLRSRQARRLKAPPTPMSLHARGPPRILVSPPCPQAAPRWWGQVSSCD